MKSRCERARCSAARLPDRALISWGLGNSRRSRRPLFGRGRKRSRRGAIGGFLHDKLNFDVVFTWRAVLLALAVMSLPLLVRSARVAFEGVNPRLEQIARTLGAGEVRVFVAVTLPLAFRGIAGGMILAFARALGELALRTF